MTPQKSVELIYRKLGKRIKARRIFLGMTTEKLGAKIGLSRPAILNIEAGRQRILVHRLLALDKALLYAPGGLLHCLEKKQ